MITKFNEEEWSKNVHVGKSNVFHTLEWKRVLEKSFGFKSRYIISKDGQVINGMFPVMQVNSFLFGKRLIALPFSFAANPIYDKEEILREMLNEIKRNLEIRSSRLIPKSIAEQFKLNESMDNYLTILDLKNEEYHWKNMDKKHRNAVRKAEKEGLVVREINSEDELKKYYKLKLKLNAKKYGIPTESFKFYKNLWNEFRPKGMIKIYFAELNGKPVAGIILFLYRDEILYYSGAADEKHLNMRPYNILIWETIKFGCSNNYKKLNFGTSSDEGLKDFKEKWGAESFQIPVYSTSKKGKEGYSLFTKIWKVIPICISKYIGPFLVKHKGG